MDVGAYPNLRMTGKTVGTTSMRFFIAGIMQGSHLGSDLHSQDYRQRIQELLEQSFEDAEVYDPFANHESSVQYDDTEGRRVFYGHNRMCREVDVVVAFVPYASMGTAIEMWEAHEHGHAAVIAVSPLETNWAVKYCSHAIYADLEMFAAALATGEVQRKITQVLEARR